MKKSKKTKNSSTNRTRFQNKRRNIQLDLIQLKKRLAENKFGTCEGIILSIQCELTLLYGLLIAVQDDNIRKNKGDV